MSSRSQLLMWVLVLVTVLPPVASGCSEPSGAAGPADGGIGGDAGAGGDGGGGAGGDDGTRCGEAHVCVPDPGADWTGPVALADPTLGCGDAFPDELLTLFEGLEPGEASCSCACGEATFPGCSEVRLAIGFGELACQDRLGQEPIQTFDCYNTFSQSHAVSMGAAITNCEPGTVSADTAPSTWARSVTACNGFTAGNGDCDEGQSCVPTPGFGFFIGICYLHEGDLACPSALPNRALLHTGYADTRRCPGSCDCQGSGAQCRINIDRYSDPGCSDHLGRGDVLSGEEVCVAPSPATQGLVMGSRNIVDYGTCSPVDPSAEGAVFETGTTTVCCN